MPGSTSLNEAAQHASVQADGLPALPDRNASAEFVASMDGTDTFSRSALAEVVPPALLLDASPEGRPTQWAIYGYDLQGKAPMGVSGTLEIAPGSEAWIALANYETNRWDMTGPYDSIEFIVMDDLAYVSPAGSVFLSVLATPGNVVSVHELTFHSDDDPDNGGGGGNGGGGDVDPDNEAPDALLETANYEIDLGAITILDATQSSDADGEIVSYEYDIDGDLDFQDAVFDLDDDPATVQFSYSTGGEYTVTLRVTDDDGAQDTDSIVITAHGLGSAQLLEDEGVTGKHTSLAVVAGRPAIAYYDEDGSCLKYRRALDAQGDQWAGALVLDDAGDVGQFASMVLVAGNPAIAYYDADNGNLKYIRATLPDGSQWGQPQLLEAINDVGQFCSLAVAAGNPAVAYYDASNGDLRFISSVDALGQTWGQPVTVAEDGWVGRYPSLCEVQDRPAISFNRATGKELHYVRALDASGSAWPAATVIDNDVNIDPYNTLLVVDGQPAIAYEGDFCLKYIRASDAVGGNWGEVQVLDDQWVTRGFSSMAIVNGVPALAWYCQGQGELRYLEALDAQGSQWSEELRMGGNGVDYDYISLAAVAGRAGISYHNVTPADLMFLRVY